jgi:hypothetical protein
MVLKTLDFNYTFTFPDGSKREFPVRIRPGDLTLIREPLKQVPDWVKLGRCQCPICPLKEAEHPNCPVAEGLVEIVAYVADSVSSQLVDIEVRTEHRTYTKKGTLATGVSSLIALCMPTSGCPILDKLRPMVFTHLPFATLEQNLHRQLATYLLAQFFRSRKGMQPDWELKGLVKMSEDIRVVNRAFCKRLRAVCRNDAAINALVHLDCLADNAAFTLQKKGLGHIERCFAAYFEEAAVRK